MRGSRLVLLVLVAVCSLSLTRSTSDNAQQMLFEECPGIVGEVTNPAEVPVFYYCQIHDDSDPFPQGGSPPDLVDADDGFLLAVLGSSPQLLIIGAVTL